ncbi:MAG: c-type cytochrome [Saprospiraceae bacterium]|nr:c-type cytochrome [Saprospiraceae bacterium]
MQDDPIDHTLISASPVLNPDMALKSFDLEPGFSIQLVAAEPVVQAPVVAHFDYDGHLWVLTMPSYMQDTVATDEDQPTGQLLKLLDKDQDGYYEDKEIKIDSLVLPRAFKILKEGILLAEPPILYYYPMTTGKVSKKLVVDSTYAPQGDVEHKPNGLYWNLDNWIYNAKSSLRYRWNPSGEWTIDTSEFRGQWGISGDDKGRLFYNHNSAALLADDLMPNWLEPNPYYTNTSKGLMGVSRTNNKVNPARINPGVNRAYLKEVLDSTGKLNEMTAACGALVYRDQQFPPSYYNSYFVCEPSANLIQRLKIDEDNQGMLKINRPDPVREFLRSTDERFRPVHLTDGPDGCIYVVDMYRGIIQHKNYLTPYLKRQITYRQLQKPLDHGRLYKICHRGKQEVPESLTNKTDSSLVSFLTHPSAYYRDRARELLIQRKAVDIQEQLIQIFDQVQDYKTQSGILWTLEGLGLMNTTWIEKAIRKETAQLHLTLLKLLEHFPQEEQIPGWLDRICTNKNLKLAALPIIQKRMTKNPFYYQWLANLEVEFSQDNDIKDAIIKTVNGYEQVYLPFSTSLKPVLNEVLAKKKLMKSLQANLKPGTWTSMLRGYDLFQVHCGICHGKNGEGITGLAPALVESEWISGDEDRLIRIVLDGLKGPILINKKTFGTSSTLMPGHRDQTVLTDQKLADILTFIRGKYGHSTIPVTRHKVNKVREETKGRQQPYEMADFIQ